MEHAKYVLINIARAAQKNLFRVSDQRLEAWDKTYLSLSGAGSVECGAIVVLVLHGLAILTVPKRLAGLALATVTSASRY